MAKIVAVTSSSRGIVYAFMAAECLKQGAGTLGHTMMVEIQGSFGVKNTVSGADIKDADVVIVAADSSVDQSRFAGKPLYETSANAVMNDSEAVIINAMARIAAVAVSAEPLTVTHAKIVAVIACPTGIAHTFMAAEGLKQSSEALGHTIWLETQGTVGTNSTLSRAEIAAADVVIIAADVKVDIGRFAGKPLYETSTKAAISDAGAVINSALIYAARQAPRIHHKSKRQSVKVALRRAATIPYRNLMTGFSYVIPFAVIGGVFTSLATNSPGHMLLHVGANAAFTLFLPVLAGFVAYSIADRPGIAPGMIGYAVSETITSTGFLGAIVAGVIAGYSVYSLNKLIKLPYNLSSLVPMIILPLVGTLISGLSMVYVVAPPVHLLNGILVNWFKSLLTPEAVGLGLFLGLIIAFDMGGPVNKIAYIFAIGLLSEQVYSPMASVMAAGMTPCLGLALATFLFKSRFTNGERGLGKTTIILGLCFITEGAIPFAKGDPLRVIPAIMIGSGVAGALAMLFECQLRVPHGGIFVLLIPNAVTNPLLYILAILIGTTMTAGVVFLLKRPVVRKDYQ